MQVFCVIMFIASASLFGVVIAQLNDILAKQAPITFNRVLRVHAYTPIVRYSEERESPRPAILQAFRAINLCECELL